MNSWRERRRSPLSAQVAIDLGGDFVQLVSAGVDQVSPTNQLLTLRDLAAARGARLVVIFDDTDTWLEGDEDLASRAPPTLTKPHA